MLQDTKFLFVPLFTVYCLQSSCLFPLITSFKTPCENIDIKIRKVKTVVTEDQTDDIWLEFFQTSLLFQRRRDVLSCVRSSRNLPYQECSYITFTCVVLLPNVFAHCKRFEAEEAWELDQEAWELDQLIHAEFLRVLSSFVVGGPAWWEERSVGLGIHTFIDLWQSHTGKV